MPIFPSQSFLIHLVLCLLGLLNFQDVSLFGVLNRNCYQFEGMDFEEVITIMLKFLVLSSILNLHDMLHDATQYVLLWVKIAQ